MEPMTNIALRAARRAGEVIARAMENLDRLEVQSKSANDYVTEVDRAAEQEIIYHLSKAYPDHQANSVKQVKMQDSTSSSPRHVPPNSQPQRAKVAIVTQEDRGGLL